MKTHSHRLISQEVEHLNQEILKEMQSLKHLQAHSPHPSQPSHPSHTSYTSYSSRPEVKPPKHLLPSDSTTVMQLKPSSKQHKGYTLSQLRIVNTITDINPKSQAGKVGICSGKGAGGKENVLKNGSSTASKTTKTKLCAPITTRREGAMKSSLKAGSVARGIHNKNQHQISEGYNPAHYLSEQVVAETLFGDCELSTSEISNDKLFPDDSLNFDLNEDVHDECVSFVGKSIQKGRHQGSLSKIPTSKEESKKRTKEKPVEYTFKPTILDKSKELTEKMGSFYDRLSTKSKQPNLQNTYRECSPIAKTYSRNRLDTLSRPRIVTQQLESSITEECTFKPVLSKNSLNQLNGCHLDVVERNMLWLNQKEQKLQKLKEVEEHERGERLRTQCSAVKLRNDYKPDKEVSLSKFGKEGLIGYFERIQQASEIKKREKQAGAKYCGRGWNGSTTKPQQFNLSSNCNTQQSYRSRSRTNTSIRNPVQKEYEKAIRELHDKIQKLNL